MKPLALTCLLLLIASTCFATTYVVRPDGTGDFPTIQAAVDACADGDVIELADGSFTGPGNRDIDYDGRSITIRSQSGNPSTCIIRVDGTPSAPHRGFYFHSQETSASVLEGITISNGTEIGWVCQASELMNEKKPRSSESSVTRDEFCKANR